MILRILQTDFVICFDCCFDNSMIILKNKLDWVLRRQTFNCFFLFDLVLESPHLTQRVLENVDT